MYWNLLEKVQPKDLRLTRYVLANHKSQYTLTLGRLDDEIFEDLKTTFPELLEPPYKMLIKLDEDWMKSVDGKDRWRKFIGGYEKTVTDYNFGSLIRTDSTNEYGETNTIFGAYRSHLYLLALITELQCTVTRIQVRSRPSF